MSAPRPPVPGLSLAPAYLVTCEHGGNRVPPAFRPYFKDCESLLHSHRGYDAGALAVARDLAKLLHAPLVSATTSRLVIDLNRSSSHPRLYSENMRGAPAALRDEAFNAFYVPFRQRAEALIVERLEAGLGIVHISSHSFTPVMDGKERQADIGLLYDPARPGEAAFCEEWLSALKRRAPLFRARRNYPYYGKSDGFCTHLRKHYSPDRYIGIELEINQKHVLRGNSTWKTLRQLVLQSLADVVRLAVP